ncbi:D-2-hydroxyacid dehydrogenase family protein [Paraburkholderia caffeinilytica]|uniref:D-2-hydroxyacid dehydrogenase family protein n=1 Tax=Paraburkholderia caffeinilytica TaxID=1761016 RepID=UPI0038BD8CBA
MKIAVLDDYPKVFRTLDCYPRLAEHDVTVFHDVEKDVARLAQRLQAFEAILLTQGRSPLPGALIEQLPNLKLVVQTGDHVEHIDVDACTRRGIAIAAGRGGLPPATVELTWGLILASMRYIPREVDNLKRGIWQTTLGNGLNGKTLGVYGPGRIGMRVAQIGAAFGMKVVCLGREGTAARIVAAGFEAAPDRRTFFENADVLSLHVPLDGTTRGIVTAADLARMKPDALLVNTARAALIEPGALVAALQRGHPGFAAVDVYEDEPVLHGAHPLLDMPNVLCTPHLGYVEKAAYESYFSIAIDGVLGFAAGRPVNLLNPQALSKTTSERRQP